MFKKDPLILIYEKMLTEAIQSTDNEYYDAVEKHYNKNLVQMIKSQDKMAEMMFGVSIQTYKTEDGSLIVRYINLEEAVVILGIVSVPGVFKTNYMKDLFRWIDQIIEKLKEGKTLITSPNKLSEPLLKQIIKKAERKGVKLSVDQSAPTVNDPESGQEWTNWIITQEE
jgi:hypothetical protein